MDIVVSLDCGIAKIKAIAFTVQGRIIACAEVVNAYTVSKGGMVEQNPALTWKKVVFVFHELIQKIPNLSSRLLVITVTGQRDGTWLIDKRGVPIGNALLHLDTRSESMLQNLVNRNIHVNIHSLTGSRINAGSQSIQMLWFKKYAKSLLSRAHTVFHCKEWVYFKLTTERGCDVSEACSTFGNFKTRSYETEIFKMLGLTAYRNIIPRIISGEREYYPLSIAAARTLGLKSGIPVVLGYVDLACLAIGLGGFHTKDVHSCSVIEPSGVHMKVYPNHSSLSRGGGNVIKSPSGHTVLLPYKQSVLRFQAHNAATLNFDWIASVLTGGVVAIYRNQSLFKAIDVHDFLIDIDKDILRTEPVNLMYHPYIDPIGESGLINDKYAQAQWIGLTSDLTYLNLLRSVYEGVSYAARHSYETLGTTPKHIYFTGSGGALTSFRKIFASVLNARLLTTSHQEPTALGAALIGCLALGVYSNLDEACKKVVDPYVSNEDPYGSPDPTLRTHYSNMFKLYKEAITTSKPLWKKLHTLSS
ncbi:erythritol kinase [Spirochaetota bacterium]|nr:erythritol kinase [Spirochaetota bacterium]